MGYSSSLRKANYQFDLAALQQLAAKNYAQLSRVLPAELAVDEQVVVAIGPLAYVLTVLEQNAYSTLVNVSEQRHNDADALPTVKLGTDIDIMMYHDARLAEVVRSQAKRGFLARYKQPNRHMHQVDEKRQINVFLAEWLGLCLSQGHYAALPTRL